MAASGFLFRIATQIALGFYEAPPETWEYDEIARNILAGNGYAFDHYGVTWRAYAPPLYTLILAAIYAVFGVAAAPIGIAQALMGGVLCAAVFRIGERVGGAGVGALSGLAAATHPGLLVYAAKVHPLSLDSALAALGVLIVLRSRERSDVAEALGGGILVGAMALTRATLAPFVVVGRGAAALGTRRPLRADLFHIAVLVFTAAAIVAPWVVRNTLVLGYPTLVTGVGEVL